MKAQKFLIMKVNSGKGRRVVIGQSLKQVQQRYPGYLVQDYIPIIKKEKSLSSLSKGTYT